MTDKQIIDCEYLKIDEMRTCKALNVSFYADLICKEGDCIILKLKQQLMRTNNKLDKIKKVCNKFIPDYYKILLIINDGIVKE